MLRALGVIPARFASTRFPGKPLAPLGNGSLLSAVWSAAAASSRLTRVIVATEDQRIVEACGKVLSETALEDLAVSPALLERLAGRAPAPRDWRALWPEAGGDAHG